MTSDAEARLRLRDLEIDEQDFGRDDAPDIGGFVALRPNEDGTIINALLHPGLAPERRARFAEWLEVKIDRFIEHGPAPDGWQRRTSDGGPGPSGPPGQAGRGGPPGPSSAARRVE